MANPFTATLEQRQAGTAPAVAGNPFSAALAQRGAGAAPAMTAAPDGTMSWGDVARGAGQNLVPSYAQAMKDAAHPVMHPVQTAKGLFNIGVGAAQKLIPGEQDKEKYADAVGQFFADRYGGIENLKQTIASDPVGFLGDVATVASLGGVAAVKGASAAGKATGKALATIEDAIGTATGRALATAEDAAPTPGAAPGAQAAPKFGEILREAGRMIDPVRLTVRGASIVGRGTGKVGSEALGWLTGAGGDAVRTAARTGALGGYLGERFRGAMRGQVDLTEVVDEAKAALNVLRHERSLAYANDMKALGKDKTVLSFDGIDDAMSRAERIGRFKNQDVSPSTARVRGEMREVIDGWKALDPKEYHTPQGLDALKQRLGDILDRQDLGTREYRAVHEVYKAVRGEVAAQAPEYAKTMRSYERASNTIRDIERSLSLGKTAGAETAVRKLQGIMRNDVSSAYGKRAEFAKKLEKAGAEGLFETMAGSQMSSALPRGMATLGGPGTVGGLAYATTPEALALLPATSPRLVGEAVHAGGRAAGPVMRTGGGLADILPAEAGLAALQTGRGVRVSEDEAMAQGPAARTMLRIPQ